MKARALAPLALAAAIAAACVLAGARALRSTGLATEGLPGARALAQRCAALDEDLRLTWFASAPESWQGDYRHLEPALRELFETLERESGGRVRCSRVDPGSDPALAAHAAALGLAPFRARTLERDGWRETTLWSSLRLVVGGRGATVVEGLSPEKLPFLARILEAQLEQLLAPRKPRILLESPVELHALERELATLGDVRRTNFEHEQPDLLFWIEPREVGAARIAALHELLERGTSVVLAGSSSIAPLLTEFGLVPLSGALVEGTQPVRSTGAEQDFRRFVGQPNGTLLFRAPTTFVPDPARLDELGLDYQVLAASSDKTQLVDPPATAGRAAPHATLAALLEPHDPWRGRLVVLGATTPFEDEFLEQDALAHRALLDVLVRSLASPERRAFAAVAATRSATLPPLADARRTWTRLLVVGGLPLLLALVWLARRPPRIRLPWRPLAIASAGVCLVALLRAALPERIALDCTREGANALAPELVALLGDCASAAEPVHARLLFSPEERLPSEYRPELAALRELLERLRSSTGLLSLEEQRVERAPEGLHMLRVTSQQDETTLVREIVAGLVLEHGARRERLEFPERSSFDDLAFRIGFAFERLRTGAGVRIAAASDRPRLSPAESRLAFESKRLFAPTGGDVFGRARELLAQHDFELESVSSEAPTAPLPAQLLLWLQPRRDIEPLRAELERTLARGGRALVAAQHYVVRPRARAEKQGEPAWWPEPQLCDLERGWPAAQGLALVHEVFFDELSTSAELEQTNEHGASAPRLARTDGANPLLVRAASDVGELLMPFPNRIRLDPELLNSAGLEARTLARSSPSCWSLDWRGGDLPPQVFEASCQQLLGPQPLAVATGSFVLVGCSQMFQDQWIERAGFENGRFLVRTAAELTLPPRVSALLARRAITPGLPWIEPRRRGRLRAATLGAAPLALLFLAAGWTLFRRRKEARA